MTTIKKCNKSSDDYKNSDYCFSVGSKNFLDIGHPEMPTASECSSQNRSNSNTSNISECRRALAKGFMADQSDIWDDFLDRFGKSEGRICYYPSAGSDFRPLVYQQMRGMERLGLANGNGEILGQGADFFNRQTYSAPDLWIYSDFRGDQLLCWLETKVVHSDERVVIRVLAHTELQPHRIEFHRRPRPAYISLPPSELTGRVFYLKLEVANEAIDTRVCDVLYFCVENVDLIHRFLLRSKITLSHLVWVCDGAGFGGGRIRHDFLIPLLAFFKTRWLLIGQRYLDSRGEVKWPEELLFYKRLLRGRTPDLREVGTFQSGSEQVAFCEVDSTLACLKIDDERWKMTERRLQEVRERPEPSVYLWLCCEGWMKFGPYEWLRFDDERQAILGPDGEEVASKSGGQWRVPGEKWQCWGFSDPTITTSPQHPHKNSSSHPRKRR